MQKTKIEYLTHTWNPIGMECTPVSAGCQNCWHIANVKRFGVINPGLRKKELQAPLRLRKPARIGVQFMGDLFHESVSFEWIDRVFGLMLASDVHTFYVLTKRPDRMFEFFKKRPSLLWAGILRGVYKEKKWPFDNVWLGVTCENQEMANERIPILLQIPAAKRFVSLEPLLSKIDSYSLCRKTNDTEKNSRSFQSESSHHQRNPHAQKLDISLIDWVIIGAETGPGHRECKPEWVESVIRHCGIAEIPVFTKNFYVSGEKVSGPELGWPREYPSRYRNITRLLRNCLQAGSGRKRQNGAF